MQVGVWEHGFAAGWICEQGLQEGPPWASRRCSCNTWALLVSLAACGPRLFTVVSEQGASISLCFLGRRVNQREAVCGCTFIAGCDRAAFTPGPTTTHPPTTNPRTYPPKHPSTRVTHIPTPINPPSHPATKPPTHLPTHAPAMHPPTQPPTGHCVHAPGCCRPRWAAVCRHSGRDRRLQGPPADAAPVVARTRVSAPRMLLLQVGLSELIPQKWMQGWHCPKRSAARRGPHTRHAGRLHCSNRSASSGFSSPHWDLVVPTVALSCRTALFKPGSLVGTARRLRPTRPRSLMPSTDPGKLRRLRTLQEGASGSPAPPPLAHVALTLDRTSYGRMHEVGWQGRWLGEHWT
jgi:hypothetical protein